MGANRYTTDQLISGIELVSHMPLSNATFTPEQILQLADWELETALMSQILSIRAGYYLEYVDYEQVESGLYPIPADAIAGALSNVELIQNTTIIPVNQIEESEQYSTISPTSTSYGFFIKGNMVQILPKPNVGFARLWYLRRPNSMVLTTAAAQITAINGATVTVSSLPSTYAIDTVINVCQDQPTFDMLSERVITNIAGTDVTLDEAVDTMVVGDWIALQNQTPVPQIPVEFRPLLIQRVVVKVYELQGYLPKMQVAQKKLEEMEKQLFSLITPRVQNQTKVIMPVNGGFMNAGRSRGNFPAGRHG